MTSSPDTRIARQWRRGRLRALSFALILSMAATPLVSAQEAVQGLEITSCTVFSELDKNITHDCVNEARKSCAGPGTCELPIGLNLTQGKDLDGNPDTWELVRVEFKCKGIAHINGPHYQNDHATMTLACQK
jgi:hypothetical protein